MSGWDEGRIVQGDFAVGGEAPETTDPVVIQRKFREFLREFREDPQSTYFTYREQLIRHVNLHKHYVEVDMDHIASYDEDLADKLKTNPSQYIDLFEAGAREAASLLLGTPADEMSAIQVQLVTNARPMDLRNLNSSMITRLVVVPGILTSASKVQTKATALYLQCRDCQTAQKVIVRPGFGGAQIPRTCPRSGAEAQLKERCSLDPFTIVGERSTCIDQQTLKLQEAPEAVPTGEMPRTVLMTVDRDLVEKYTTGTRVVVVGIYSVFESRTSRGDSRAVAVRTPYVRVLGMRLNDEGSGHTTTTFTPEEEADFRDMARDPEVYQRLCSSIAPAIYGFDDIKKAVATLLFGGSRKSLPDGSRLRGDVNVLLLGDPSTAKSQMLKFVERCAPIAVYTSGKGSSAAGLTAAVIRDASSGEFVLEGGAMVLADGGVVCIDEFDKMREQDRVAIHEAMEQQTISIAKAGITTILNSRAAVLAAANPIFGRYDDLQTPADNIDFQSTILSRFDMIFIVRDTREEHRDRTMAQHIVKIHMNAVSTEAPEGEIGIQTLKKYVAFCRQKCSPRLSDRAARVLQNHYVAVRARVKEIEQETSLPPTIPITVRQLEAIIRIAEALAKMQLSSVVTDSHVEEAVRLFNASTVDAVNSGSVIGDGLPVGQDIARDIARAEEFLRRFIPIRGKRSVKQVEDGFAALGSNVYAVRKAIAILVQREELQFRNQRRVLLRLR